jgi:hypothetical protein
VPVASQPSLSVLLEVQVPEYGEDPTFPWHLIVGFQELESVAARGVAVGHSDGSWLLFGVFESLVFLSYGVTRGS